MVQTRYIFNFKSNLGINDDFEKAKREREMYKKRKSF